MVSTKVVGVWAERSGMTKEGSRMRKQRSARVLLVGHKLRRGRGIAVVSAVHGHVVWAFTLTEKGIGTHPAHRIERTAVLAASTATLTKVSRNVTPAHALTHFKLWNKRRRVRRALAIEARTGNSAHIHTHGTHVSPVSMAQALHAPVMGHTATSPAKPAVAGHIEALRSPNPGGLPFVTTDGSSGIGLEVRGREGIRVGLGSNDLLLSRFVGSDLVVRGVLVVSAIMVATVVTMTSEEGLHMLLMALGTRVEFELLKERWRVGTVVSVLVTSATDALGKFTTIFAMLVVLAKATPNGKPGRDKPVEDERHKARGRTHEAMRAVEVFVVATEVTVVRTSLVVIVLDLRRANSELRNTFNCGWQKVSDGFRVEGEERDVLMVSGVPSLSDLRVSDDKMSVSVAGVADFSVAI